MLELKVSAKELYDHATSQFIDIAPVTLLLEHSLISISKWEAKWKKSFISKGCETNEEWFDYIRCMSLNKNAVDPLVYSHLSQNEFDQIIEYIDDSHTATHFNEDPKKQKRMRETITSELIYYWMFSAQIPIECQKWHINRLLALIRVFGIKQSASTKKMGKKDIYKQNRQLNAIRKAKRH